MFPSYIHIGADEVKVHCWTDNSTYVEGTKTYWDSRGISPTDTTAIGEYFYSKTLPIFDENTRKIIAW